MVKIENIMPPITQRELFLHRRCYMGISIGNPNFEGEPLAILLQWIAQNFDECLIVVGDYLQRYNETIFYNRRGREAEIESIRLGDRYLERVAPQLEKARNGKFRITRWKDYLDKPTFHDAKKTLEELFVTSYEFRESIDRTSSEFISRQMKNKNAPVIDKKDAIALSTQYILEEIAVFSALVGDGWAVEVYPGSEIPVLVDIAKGKFSFIPEPLRHRINVELRITRKVRPLS